MNMIIQFIMFFWDSFILWLNNLFVTPFTNLSALWVLIPVYLGLAVSEFFQEKRGTSLGNATSNSIIVLWGGIDFMRVIFSDNSVKDFHYYGKMIIASAILIYGLLILVEGIRADKIIKKIAKISVVCYFIIIFTPLYYASVPISWMYIIGSIIFFPLFYMTIQLLDNYMPDPKTLIEDVKEASGYSNNPQNLNAGNDVKIGW